ncbi:transcription factor SPT20 [Vespula maculifrons]|uniref:Transcription factor SPT20 n=1 Tax=Vespula maculifrons TaxID=7453 RepID=A0ABD2CLM7_VESMC
MQTAEIVIVSSRGLVTFADVGDRKVSVDFASSARSTNGVKLIALQTLLLLLLLLLLLVTAILRKGRSEKACKPNATWPPSYISPRFTSPLTLPPPPLPLPPPPPPPPPPSPSPPLPPRPTLRARPPSSRSSHIIGRRTARLPDSRRSSDVLPKTTRLETPSLRPDLEENAPYCTVTIILIILKAIFNMQSFPNPKGEALKRSKKRASDWLAPRTEATLPTQLNPTQSNPTQQHNVVVVVIRCETHRCCNVADSNKQSRAEQSRTEQNRAEQNRTEQNRTEQRKEENRIAEGGPIDYSRCNNIFFDPSGSFDVHGCIVHGRRDHEEDYRNYKPFKIIYNDMGDSICFKNEK